jgi:hypothetical protein
MSIRWFGSTAQQIGGTKVPMRYSEYSQDANIIAIDVKNHSKHVWPLTKMQFAHFERHFSIFGS